MTLRTSTFLKHKFGKNNHKWRQPNWSVLSSKNIFHIKIFQIGINDRIHENIWAMHILIHTKIKIMYSFNKISSKLTRCFNTYKAFPQKYYRLKQNFI